MKLRLSVSIGAIHVSERIFCHIIRNDENTRRMTNALTGEVCNTSVIYKDYLFLRDDRCNGAESEMWIDFKQSMEVVNE